MTQIANHSESYVPRLYLDAISSLVATGSMQSRTLNQKFQELFPGVPRSTRNRWIRSVLGGTAHDTTPSWHRRTEEPKSIVPRRFSALASGRYLDERKRWAADGEIRLVNMTCLHRPLGDGALISLAMQIIHDFKPNILPAMTDWLHMNRFSQHPPRPQTFVPEIPREFDEEGKPTPRVNKFKELKTLSVETIDMFRTVTPKNCTYLNMWGNHEHWVLRELLRITQMTNDTDLVENFVDDTFQMFEDKDVLWCEMDERRFLPLTKHLILAHGWLARGGQNAGVTANAYLNKFKGQVSIAAGHTHRQEVEWMKGPRSEHFAAVAGTMGLLRNVYNGKDFVSHNWGFQLITHPMEGWKGADVENVRFYYKNGYYMAKWRGREYSEKATFDYDPLLDLFEIGDDDD